MSLWGNLDAANNAPKQGDTSGYGGSSGSVTANTQVYYGNTKTSAFVTGAQIGVFGVDQTETQVARRNKSPAKPTHSGWVIRKAGMGPVVSVTANAGAVGVNTHIVFSRGETYGGSGNTTANAVISVNTAGYITSIAVTTPGLYANTPNAAIFTGSSNAVFTITMGGRANRVQTETIVAFGGNFTGDGTVSDDILYPDS
jgi:hypothetical protein